MVAVFPFKGFRYVESKVGKFDNAVAPPYDVINGPMQEKLHGLSPYNIAKVTRGEKRDTDSDLDNEYTRAAGFLDQWVAEGALTQEDAPAIYAHSQEFEAAGATHTRIGFISLLKLEEFCKGGGDTCVGVHQHEETLAKDIIDRLSLLRATKTNLGQIFCIYGDKEGEVDGYLKEAMQAPALMEVTDDENVIHRLWAITDEGKLQDIQQIMADKSLIIADGHHRYKTALQYSKENTDDAAQLRMMTIVNMFQEGLVVLPTHRLIQNVDDFNAEILLEKIGENFEVEEFSFTQEDEMDAREKMFSGMKSVFDAGGCALGCYCKTQKYYILKLKDTGVMDSVSGHSDAWKKLDVTVLHSIILDRMLGIDKEKLAAGTIGGGSLVEYVKDIGDAVQESIDKVNGGYQTVFYMNPTRVEEVETVATGHETMPQKSTFFYPKIFTGFTLYRL